MRVCAHWWVCTPVWGCAHTHTHVCVYMGVGVCTCVRVGERTRTRITVSEYNFGSQFSPSTTGSRDENQVDRIVH